MRRGALRKHVSAHALIEQVRVNPFLLRVEVLGLTLPDVDNQRWIAADRVLLDLSMATLWRGYPVIEQCSLQQPFFKLHREPAERATTDTKDWREQVAGFADMRCRGLKSTLKVEGGQLEYLDSTTARRFTYRSNRSI